jgi:formamidopyrimidine-DNA glycosylase
LRDALVGRSLTAARRQGKTIWIETSGLDGAATPGPDLGVHLGMSGSIVVIAPDGEAAQAGEPQPAWRGSVGSQPGKLEWDRFTLEFADGGRLALFDKRRLGRVRLNPDISVLGPDAEEITPEQFRRVFSTGTIAVKARLLDQSKIAGIGNLLADEALWQARIFPAAPVGSLRPEDVDRLYRAVQAALKSAAIHGGAHTGEIIPFRHEGARCPRDGAEMKHGTVGGRSTWWCSREQAPTRRARPRRARTRRAGPQP